MVVSWAPWFPTQVNEPSLPGPCLLNEKCCATSPTLFEECFFVEMFMIE